MILQGNFYDRGQTKNEVRFVTLERNILSQYKDKKQTKPFKKIQINFACSFVTRKEINVEKTMYVLKINHNKGCCTLATQNKSQYLLWYNELFLTIPHIYFDGNWIETQKIGSGHFSQVQRVTDKNGRIFALKTIKKMGQQQDKIKQLKSIQNEIKIMRRLQSPNLIKLEGIYADNKNFYLKIPFFQGGTLSYLKKQKLLSYQDIKIAMKDLLTGLLQLKRCKVIHRDIKPQNIVMHKVNGQKRFVIIDFGLATFANAQYIYYRCGTPGYLSPQIANMNSKSTRIHLASDLFSLGAVFYYMIVGKMLFAGNKDVILYKNRKCCINFKSQQFNKFFPDEKDLLMRLLQKDPNARITPQEALKHSYFTNTHSLDEFQQIPDQENDISKKMSKLTLGKKIPQNGRQFSTETSASYKSFLMSSGQSNLLTFQNFQKAKKLSISKMPKGESLKVHYRRSSFLEQSKRKSLLVQLSQQKQ